MDMFIEVVVFVLVAGDDIFALLICDEDLEYGARYWCLLVGTLGKFFSCVNLCEGFLFC